MIKIYNFFYLLPFRFKLGVAFVTKNEPLKKEMEQRIACRCLAQNVSSKVIQFSRRTK